MTRRPPRVKLLDGRMVDSSSEEWRHECEARYAVGLQGERTPERYLADIRKLRGDQAAERLRETMAAVWRARARA